MQKHRLGQLVIALLGTACLVLGANTEAQATQLAIHDGLEEPLDNTEFYESEYDYDPSIAESFVVYPAVELDVDPDIVDPDFDKSEDYDYTDEDWFYEPGYDDWESEYTDEEFLEEDWFYDWEYTDDPAIAETYILGWADLDGYEPYYREISLTSAPALLSTSGLSPDGAGLEAIPEPGVTIGLGLVGLGWLLKRRRVGDR